MQNKKIILAFTGSSGAGYGLRLLYHLAKQPVEIHAIVSPVYFRILKQELNLISTPASLLADMSAFYSLPEGDVKCQLRFFPHGDIGCEPASGSARYDAMAIVPCSMKTLAGIAHGYTTNLIERAADVSLKERRPLVLVPRETPYSLIHLENMRLLTLAGAVIMPASPGFYRRPVTMTDLYDFMADRILGHLGFHQRTIDPWQGDD